MKKMTYFPRTKLSEAVGGFGGVARDDAVEGALKQLESMRGESDAVIGTSIAALERTAQAPEQKNAYSADQMQELLNCGDQIVTLAGTFGYQALDAATRGLCDVVSGLMAAGLSETASVQVHVRAIRLLAPGAPALPPAQVAIILSELAKILDHHGFARGSDIADKADVEQ